jgi:penicillin amidase
MTEAEILQQDPHYPSNGPTIVQAEDMGLKVVSKRKAKSGPGRSISSIYGQFFDSKSVNNQDESANKEDIDIFAMIKKYAGFDVRLKASNNWVISGNRTLSGKPLLCNDPHLFFQVRRSRIYYFKTVS